MSKKSEKVAKPETQTLGEFLKGTREAANLSLDDAQDSTKIPLNIIKAMERDDFSCMPAEAFCRGFYVMFAKFLQLNPEEVLSRYLEARDLPPIAAKMQSTPPVRKSGQFRNYSEPSAISPLMSSIFALFILLAVIIGGCWYFNWNPIGYLNSKLDTVQTKGQQEEAQEQQEEVVIPPPAQVQVPVATLAPAPAPDFAPPEQIEEEEITEVVAPTEDSVETIATETENDETIAVPAPYHLEIDFRNSGTLTATLDKGFLIDKEFEIGQTLQWDANESIILDMPESIDATIRMNGIEIPLPDVENGRRLLSLPEDLLN